MALSADAVQVGPWNSVRYDLPAQECANDELNSMENCRIGPAGWLASRKGTLSYQSASAIGGAPTVTMVAAFKTTATTTHVVIVAGTAIYKYAGGWSAITGSVTVTAGDDNTWEYADCNGTLVATNGVDTNAWKWTGSGNASDLDDDSRFSKGKHVAWFDNRCWIGNVDGASGQLWHSDTADIETWAATSFFNFGGRITGLVATQNALVVHTTDGIYTLIPTGNANSPYHPQRRTFQAGVDGRSVVALPDDTQLMILDEGIHIWEGGATLRKVSHALDGADYWDNVNTSRLHQAFAFYWPLGDEVWFVLPIGSSTKPDNIMVYSRRRQIVLPGDRASGAWHGPLKGWERNCGAIINGKPHLGDFDGILWDHQAGDDDNGRAIDSKFETAHPAPAGDDVKVRWLNARHFYDGKGSFSLVVSQKGTEITGTTIMMKMTGSGFVLDSGKLDKDALSEVLQLSQDTRLSSFSAHSGLECSMNSADQSFTYYKTQLRYKTLGRHRKPRPE